MVAAQYILLAGRKIAEECFGGSNDVGLGPDTWRAWVAKFEEISREEGEDAAGVAAVAGEAHKIMVSIRPEQTWAKNGAGEGN